MFRELFEEHWQNNPERSHQANLAATFRRMNQSGEMNIETAQMIRYTVNSMIKIEQALYAAGADETPFQDEFGPGLR